MTVEDDVSALESLATKLAQVLAVHTARIAALARSGGEAVVDLQEASRELAEASGKYGEIQTNLIANGFPFGLISSHLEEERAASLIEPEDPEQEWSDIDSIRVRIELLFRVVDTQSLQAAATASGCAIGRTQTRKKQDVRLDPQPMRSK